MKGCVDSQSSFSITTILLTLKSAINIESQYSSTDTRVVTLNLISLPVYLFSWRQ